MADTLYLYLVVSEPLTYVVCEDWTVNACHEEDYCIAELVVARNRSQATYLAWKSDRTSFDPANMREKPRFRSERKRRDVKGPARIVSDVWQTEDNVWTFRKDSEPQETADA